MRRAAVLICLVLLSCGRVGGASAAAPTPTVKSVALAFGQALRNNDGGAALNLLAPELRAHLSPNQLPAVLGVVRPPRGAMVIRWAFAQGQGNATLGLRYAGSMVTEQLSLRLYSDGWRITAISPRDAAALEQGAETAVTAFCDGALNGDPAMMRAQATSRLLKKWRKSAWSAALLGLRDPIRSYQMADYQGDALGAEIVVVVRSATRSVRDRFEVINDRDGWRVAGVWPQGN